MEEESKDDIDKKLASAIKDKEAAVVDTIEIEFNEAPLFGLDLTQ